MVLSRPDPIVSTLISESPPYDDTDLLISEWISHLDRSSLVWPDNAHSSLQQI